MSRVLHQLTTHERSSWTSSNFEVLGSEWESLLNSFISSEKFKSAFEIKTRSGPKTLPCGTLLQTGSNVEEWPSLTRWCLSVRKNASQNRVGKAEAFDFQMKYSVKCFGKIQITVNKQALIYRLSYALQKGKWHQNNRNVLEESHVYHEEACLKGDRRGRFL